MSSIGDKKVALNLSDGTSVNLNKPKIIPASITKISDITDPGWYIGGTVAGTGPQSLEDESKPVASSADSDNGIAAQSNESDSIFKLYDDSEINYVITDAPFENLLTSKIFILYVYPIISKSTGSNAVDGNDPDISGFGYLLMTRYGNLHIGTRTTNAEVITWDQIATRHDINHIIEYFQQYYIIDNLTSTDTDKALSANQGKELKSLIDDLHVKSIDSSITDLVSIVDSGTYAGTTDFDKTDADNDGKMYYTSSLTNWPGSIINGHSAMSAVAYILRVTAFYAYAEHSVRVYYELHCLNHDIQKAYGIKSNGHINWNYGGTHVEDSLESYMPQYALSANQGRVLNDKISNLTKSDVGLDKVDNTADADKYVNNADTAQRLATMSDDGGTITAITAGSTSKPVYIDNGIPKALTSTVGSAANPVYMKNGTITAGTYTFSASTTDLTAGTSTLATNEIRFIYE